MTNILSRESVLSTPRVTCEESLIKFPRKPSSGVNNGGGRGRFDVDLRAASNDADGWIRHGHKTGAPDAVVLALPSKKAPPEMETRTRASAVLAENDPVWIGRIRPLLLHF
jgi:hypothetical protein